MANAYFRNLGATAYGHLIMQFSTNANLQDDSGSRLLPPEEE